MNAYTVTRADRAADTDLSEGNIVYTCNGHDYGCANDDSRLTGIIHISVTRDPDGGYPFFTIPLKDLVPISVTTESKP